MNHPADAFTEWLRANPGFDEDYADWYAPFLAGWLAHERMSKETGDAAVQG